MTAIHRVMAWADDSDTGEGVGAWAPPPPAPPVVTTMYDLRSWTASEWGPQTAKKRIPPTKVKEVEMARVTEGLEEECNIEMC